MTIEQVAAWWSGGSGDATTIAPQTLALRLALATMGGFVVAGIHRVARGGKATSTAPFATTLVLLTVLVALTAVVIGDNVARAFGIVGALSIVRFRTAVEDTRDTAFVIFAVVAGMALGVSHRDVALVGLPFVGIVALVLARFVERRVSAPRRRLIVRVAPGLDPAALVVPWLERHTRWHRLAAAGTARQGALFEAKWDVRLNSVDEVELLGQLRALGAVDGVQHAELAEFDS
jgi:hypothetical protein